jgi:hypothetical protein
MTPSADGGSVGGGGGGSGGSGGGGDDGHACVVCTHAITHEHFAMVMPCCGKHVAGVDCVARSPAVWCACGAKHTAAQLHAHIKAAIIMRRTITEAGSAHIDSAWAEIHEEYDRVIKAERGTQQLEARFRTRLHETTHTHEAMVQQLRRDSRKWQRKLQAKKAKAAELRLELESGAHSNGPR